MDRALRAARGHGRGLGDGAESGSSFPVAVLALSLVALDRLLDELLRRQMEQRLNDRLRGYAVTLRGLDFHVLGGRPSRPSWWSRQSIRILPVAHIPRLSAG